MKLYNKLLKNYKVSVKSSDLLSEFCTIDKLKLGHEHLYFQKNFLARYRSPFGEGKFELGRGREGMEGRRGEEERKGRERKAGQGQSHYIERVRPARVPVADWLTVSRGSWTPCFIQLDILPLCLDTHSYVHKQSKLTN
jgi:hypothetical protein